MERLCDEIIQIILNCLVDPSHFRLVSRRCYAITQDPYVRALYFISRYGRTQAFYYAFDRGKLLNEKVIDIMISGGAHLSRYLAQCAIHHYFRAQVHFIKSRWVKSVPLSVFTHFMMVASRMYGDIPTGKGDDDGAIFSAVLKTSRLPVETRAKWETLKEVVEKYKFIPFCIKDPMMVQFPLVLAVEPRLLPYARANGFVMDRKYRNFVFRKMFEKPAIPYDGRIKEVVNNVRELTRLDPNMFVTRTVAAEVCMDSHLNDTGYDALKILDKEGVLKFSLALVVEELFKTFINTRSVGMVTTYQVIQKVYPDFPSDDQTVRLVILCNIFFYDLNGVPTSVSVTGTPSLAEYVESCEGKIEKLGLAPVTRQDLLGILTNKFTPDRFGGILEYGRTVLGLSPQEMAQLRRDAALASLEVGCKGKMLEKLVELDPSLRDDIAKHILQNMRLEVEDLPPSEDEEACRRYEARLCRDFVHCGRYRYPVANVTGLQRAEAPNPNQAPHPMANDATPAGDVTNEANLEMAARDETLHDDDDSDGEDEPEADNDVEELGHVGQDTLTTMIRKDELAPSARRRRLYDMYATYADNLGKSTCPGEYTYVGRWINGAFGHRHPVTAIFMLHAVINENMNGLQIHAYHLDTGSLAGRIPVTLKHFKMLARLGRQPHIALYDDIEAGAEFYFDEDDYLEANKGVAGSGNPSRARGHRMKTEITPVSPMILDAPPGDPKSNRSRKRPRRSATMARSYVIPDSDDDAIAEVGRVVVSSDFAKKRRSETNLQRWIKHLSVLLKEEQRKSKEKRKREQATAEPGAKVRVPRSEFFKSLSTNLSRLRKADREKRQQLYGADVPSEDYSEGEEDEYQYRTTRSKRRRV